MWPVTRGKKHSMEIDPEMIGMIKLADKDIETTNINMFKYLKENMRIVRRETDDTKRTTNRTSRDEKYDTWNERFTRGINKTLNIAEQKIIT